MGFKKVLRVIVANCISIAVMAALLEFLLSMLLVFPPLSPTLLPAVKSYYNTFDRSIVQFEPECGMFDQKLFYTYRPGACRFKNREFDITFRNNSAGMRDTEDALREPEIVVLGDSQASGWGVEQDQTFPALLGKLTGKRILNAAVSSYGTVREFVILRRADLSKLKTIIIQYNINDIEENDAFLDAGYVFTPSSQVLYDQGRVMHDANRKYYLGKYTHRLFPELYRCLIAKGNCIEDKFKTHSPEAVATAAAHFTDIVERETGDMPDVQLIVIPISGDNLADKLFTTALMKEHTLAKYPARIRGMKVVEFYQNLPKGTYNTIDEHMKPSGHQLAATRLLAALK